MATIVTNTIISAGGGDYTTIALWESGTDNDLVTADEVRVGEIRPKGSDWNENITILGATTDATRFRRLNVRVADRHDGIRLTGERVNPTSTGHVFTVSEDYFQVEWFEVSHTAAANSNEAFRVNNTGFFCRHMLIHDLAVENCDGVYAGANGITITVENSIFHEIDRTACHLQAKTTVTFKVYNCSAVNVTASGTNDYCVFGFDDIQTSTGSTMEVRNCIAHRGNTKRVRYSGLVGTFQDGEGVSFSPSGATATILFDTGTRMHVKDIVGTITTADDITGDTSGATANVDSLDAPMCYQEESGGAGVYTANSDFNASSDATASAEFGATNTIDDFDAASEFIAAAYGAEDLHLKSTSQFIDAGEDLSTPISETEDIDGAARTGTWDMGADEAGTIVTPGLASVLAAGFAPVILVITLIKPGLAAPVITGLAPTIELAVQPGLAAPVFTGFAPSITTLAGPTIEPGVAAMTVTGLAPTVGITALPAPWQFRWGTQPGQLTQEALIRQLNIALRELVHDQAGAMCHRDKDMVIRGQWSLTGLPESDPAEKGKLWNDGGTVKVSSG